MTLIELLKTTVLDVLAPKGWQELFARHGLVLRGFSWHWPVVSWASMP